MNCFSWLSQSYKHCSRADHLSLLSLAVPLERKGPIYFLEADPHLLALSLFFFLFSSPLPSPLLPSFFLPLPPPLLPSFLPSPLLSSPLTIFLPPLPLLPFLSLLFPFLSPTVSSPPPPSLSFFSPSLSSAVPLSVYLSLSFFLSFRDWVLLCSPVWLGTHYITQAGITITLLSQSLRAGLQAVGPLLARAGAAAVFLGTHLHMLTSQARA